ncbi:UNVERIFIED_CONTAM: hypothetical protein Sindi_1657000, partial [Sesamum indicum]
ALPPIHEGNDRIIWHFEKGRPTTQALYRLWEPPRPMVGWASLLSGLLKILRHNFILWLAILGKLLTTDRPCASQLLDGLYASLGLTETGHGMLNGQHENGKENTSSTLLTGLSLRNHIWREWNLRRFEDTRRPPSILATVIVEDVRQRILSKNIPYPISSCALYRL